MLKVAILDDYQNVSHEFVDLKKLSGKYGTEKEAPTVRILKKGSSSKRSSFF